MNAIALTTNSDPLASLQNTIAATSTQFLVSEQHFTFGNDTNTNVTTHKEQCNLLVAELNDTCHVTQFATFLQKVNHILPFFTDLHLIATCVLIVLTAILFIYALFKRPETEQLWQSTDPSAPNYIRV